MPVVLYTADFSATPLTGSPPLAVTFTNLSSPGGSTSPDTSSWTFGDGATSTDKNPTHTYIANGTYTVTLTCTWGVASRTATKTAYIVATAPYEPIHVELTKPDVGGYSWIELFILDITVHGGPVLYFTPATVQGITSASFGGVVYTALPLTGTGWETSIDGAPPRPSLTVSNVSRFIQPYCTQYKDLVGARVTRLQTLSKYLDSGSTLGDSTQIFGQSTYLIEQKSRQNKMEIEFKLASVIDAPQFKLPKGQVTRAIFPGAGLFRK